MSAAGTGADDDERRGNVHGSWNMMTTSSTDTWTSAHDGYGLRFGQTTRRCKIPLSMPSAPSRIAASKLASVFSGYAAEACGGCRSVPGCPAVRVGRCLPRDGPSTRVTSCLSTWWTYEGEGRGKKGGVVGGEERAGERRRGPVYMPWPCGGSGS